MTLRPLTTKGGAFVSKLAVIFKEKRVASATLFSFFVPKKQAEICSLLEVFFVKGFCVFEAVICNILCYDLCDFENTYKLLWCVLCNR